MSRYIMSDFIDSKQSYDSNGQRLIDILNKLKVNYILLEGVYQGQNEPSYLFKSNEAMILRLLADFNQECAAVMSKNRGFGLVYPDGSYNHLGQWETSYNQPLTDSYSYNPSNGLYLFTR